MKKEPWHYTKIHTPLGNAGRISSIYRDWQIEHLYDSWGWETAVFFKTAEGEDMVYAEHTPGDAQNVVKRHEQLTDQYFKETDDEK